MPTIRLLFRPIILIIAIFVSNTVLADGQQSIPVAEMIDRHPGLKKCERFFQAYATAVAAPLNGINKFVDAVDNKTPVCNRLCKAHVVPEFRVEGVATCTDLIVYVFSSTCFGFLPDQAHRGDALQQLENYAELLKADSFHNEEDRNLFRRRVGDIMLSWERSSAPYLSKSFPKLRKAWLAASPKDGNLSHVRSASLHCDAQAAAYNACRVEQPHPKTVCFTKGSIATESPPK
jgi:hypothetical protein